LPYEIWSGPTDGTPARSSYDGHPAAAPADASLDVLSVLAAPARRLGPRLGLGLVIGFLLGRLDGGRP
jgi:hypothetical protein